jgi:hypothetical protein
MTCLFLEEINFDFEQLVYIISLTLDFPPCVWYWVLGGFCVCWIGVHHGIYRGSYNISNVSYSTQVLNSEPRSS